MTKSKFQTNSKSQNTNLRKLIDKKLAAYLPSEKKEPKMLHKAMRYSVFPGGKRVRPVILIEAAEACGGSTKNAVPAASAIELIHTYSLIHDDLPSMDDDDYRRGVLSCHKKFGVANAVLAGDALLTLAFEMIANEYSPGTGMEMVRELSCAIGSMGMAGGQALDIAKHKDIKTINRLKTAKLFEVSVVMGALSAGASASMIEALRRYGLSLGMAFQAVDDSLDGESRVSRKAAEGLIAKAKNVLKIFGSRADGLKEIANGIIRPLASLRGAKRRSNR